MENGGRRAKGDKVHGDVGVEIQARELTVTETLLGVEGADYPEKGEMEKGKVGVEG